MMALVAPACAVVLFRSLGWWNPWLWGSCGVGLALAMMLGGVVMLLKRPHGITEFSSRLADRQADWFPFFFVVVQSLIASLIIMFVWFSITALILELPLYVHIILVLLTLLIPVRRYIWANISYTSTNITFERLDEIFHGLWHILLSVFAARSIIGLTVSDINSRAFETVSWQIIIWSPALLYSLFTAIMTTSHLMRGQTTPAKTRRKSDSTDGEIFDRF